MYQYKQFKFSVSDPKKTDLTLVSVEDERTGFTVRTALPNAGKQTASIMAFAGARFSRSDLSAHDIFEEIKNSGANAQEKLANIFRNYGHASVADMALLFAYIEQVPDNYHVEFFYDSRVGAGQVRSTRYQDFTASYPPEFSTYVEDEEFDYSELEKEYLDIYAEEIRLNKKYIEKVKEEFTKFYKPEKDNKQHEGALLARTFDTARAFLPMGANTSLAYITSAREWARMISVMKADNRYMIQCLGEQLEILFAPPEEVQKELDYLPEAPDLIQFTKADETLNESLEKLHTPIEGNGKSKVDRNFKQELPQSVEVISGELSSAEIAFYQVMLTFYPQLSIKDARKYMSTLTTDEKKEIGKLMYDDFNHHQQLGRQAELSSFSFKISATYAELKDLNRHRAWARFAPVWETDNIEEILLDGYVLPLYLQNKGLESLKEMFKKDLEDIYNRLKEFYDKLPDEVNKRVLLNILPAAHKIDYYMHASPKEISYLANLRVRPGGHINYRTLAYMIAEKASNIDPLLSGLHLGKSKKPDPASREEFFDRS